MLEKCYPTHIYSTGLWHNIFNIILVEMFCLYLLLCSLWHDHFYVWKLEYELVESRHILLFKQNYCKLGVMACTNRGISHNINTANTARGTRAGIWKPETEASLFLNDYMIFISSLLQPGLWAFSFFLPPSLSSPAR